MQLNSNLEGLSLIVQSLLRPENTGIWLHSLWTRPLWTHCPCLREFICFFLTYFWELGFGRLFPILVLRDSVPTAKEEISRHLLLSNHHWNVLITKELLEHSSWHFSPWSVHTVAWSLGTYWALPPIDKKLCPGNHYRSKRVIHTRAYSHLSGAVGMRHPQRRDQNILWADLHSRMSTQIFGK